MTAVEPILQVEELTTELPTARGVLRRLRGGAARSLAALSDVSFDILPGEILSVVGESGSGKTTLGRCMLRLVEPTSGEVRFEGENVLAAARGDMRVLRGKMQMIFQDPYASLNPSMSVRQMLAEALMVHGIARLADARDDDFLEMVAPVGDELIIDKTSAGTFNSTPIDQILRNMGRDRLLVCGIVTEGCVELTARDAADRGYFVTLVRDGCASSTRLAHFDALQRMTDGGLIRARTVAELCHQIETTTMAGARVA